MGLHFWPRLCVESSFRHFISNSLSGYRSVGNTVGRISFNGDSALTKLLCRYIGLSHILFKTLNLGLKLRVGLLGGISVKRFTIQGINGALGFIPSAPTPVRLACRASCGIRRWWLWSGVRRVLCAPRGPARLLWHARENREDVRIDNWWRNGRRRHCLPSWLGIACRVVSLGTGGDVSRFRGQVLLLHCDWGTH